MAEILEQALDVALDKKDPKRKLERRKARQKVAKATPRPDEVAKDVAPGVEDEPARVEIHSFRGNRAGPRPCQQPMSIQKW